MRGTKARRRDEGRERTEGRSPGSVDKVLAPARPAYEHAVQLLALGTFPAVRTQVWQRKKTGTAPRR